MARHELIWNLFPTQWGHTRCLSALLLAVALAAVTVNAQMVHKKPLIIAHRGAPCLYPDEVLDGYVKAIADGADYIEMDVVSTADDQLVLHHDIILDHTTNVKDFKQFKGRYTKKMLPDGTRVAGYLVSDFTLAELMLLRAKQPFHFRNHADDGKYKIATLQQVLALAMQSIQDRRPIGLYIETKSPYYHDAIRKPLEPAILKLLRDEGFENLLPTHIILQSYERESLQTFATLLKAENMAAPPLVWLVSCEQPPATEDLKAFAQYGQGIGAAKELLMDVENTPECAKDAGYTCSQIGHYCNGRLKEPWDQVTPPTSAIFNAMKSLGLFVHVYTFRNEGRFMVIDFASDVHLELDYFAGPYGLGIDGFFIDCPKSGLDWVASWVEEEHTLNVTTQNGVPQVTVVKGGSGGGGVATWVFGLVVGVLGAFAVVAVLLMKSPNKLDFIKEKEGLSWGSWAKDNHSDEEEDPRYRTSRQAAYGAGHPLSTAAVATNGTGLELSAVEASDSPRHLGP